MTNHPTVTTWRKARRSGEQGGNCVEVAAIGASVAVRDSKAPAMRLSVTTDEWSNLLTTVNER